jgi:outer membrane protein OmpA-like peptidoglycan-associated protein
MTWWWLPGRPREQDDATRVREEAAPELVRRPGDPLDAAARRRMEQSLGAGLRGGGVQHGAGAGRDVYFGAGTYAPQTSSGQRLLAHEQAHVAQQGGGGGGGAAGALKVPSVTLALPFETVRIDAFASGQATLEPAHEKILDGAAAAILSALASSPDTFVSVTGFTDAVDSEKNNLVLGQRRADAVVDYLARKGVPRSVMRAGSLGESMLLVESKTAEPRNRRVDVDIHRRSFFPLPKLDDSPLSTKRWTPYTPPPVLPPINLDLQEPPKQIGPVRPKSPVDETLTPEFEEKLRRAREMKAPTESISDLSGAAMGDFARRLGLPKWIQEKAESLGKDLPAKGLKAAVDTLMSDPSIDENTREALRKALEALSKLQM